MCVCVCRPGVYTTARHGVIHLLGSTVYIKLIIPVIIEVGIVCHNSCS